MNPLRRILPTTAVLGLLALGARALGQTQSYVQKTRTINAAVLLLDSDKPNTTDVYGQTAAPFAFYNLDQAEGAKPLGWNFVNPYAPGFTTKELFDRYVELGDTNGPANPDLPGREPQPISKRQGAYWTTRLASLSESQVSTYDVLLIAPRYKLELNPKERDLLRRFVDGGGVLWVDLGAAATQVGINSAHNLPFAVQLGSGFTQPAYRDTTSPVIDGPRQVTDSDLGLLTAGSSIGLIPVNATGPGGDSNNLPLQGEFGRYRSVVAASSGSAFAPVISEARLGEGTIVVTARAAAMMLNRAGAPNIFAYGAGSPLSSNIGFQAYTPKLNAQGRAAARLAVNIVSLGSNYRQPEGGPRKSNASSTETGSPVLARLNTEQPAGSTTAGYGPGGVVPYGSVPNGVPVTYKGYLVASIGGRIVVMDSIPGRDLDGDGDPDDGIADNTGATVNAWRDVSVGQPLDVVWVSNQIDPVKISAPVCAEVPEAGGANADQILVTDNSGNLHVFALSVTAAGGYRLQGGTHTELYAVAAPGPLTHTPSTDPYVTVPISPTVYDGLAYVADCTTPVGLGASPPGRIWVADLGARAALSSGTSWYVGGNPAIPSFTASPTIGYIPIGDTSGGVDRVLYGPGTVGTNSQPSFVSLWLGAKGETPDSVVVEAGVVKITTRAGANGNLPIYIPGGSPTFAQMQLAPHITILDANGNPLNFTDWATSAPGTLGGGVLQFTTGKTPAEWANVGVRVDYAIDWGSNPGTLSAQIIRGSLTLPIAKNGATPDSTKRILGPIALTPHGTLHLVEATPPGITNLTDNMGSDSYFAIREDAGTRGQFRVVARYTLNKAYTQTFNNNPGGTTVPAVLGDADFVQTFIPALPNKDVFTDWRFAGGIALKDGVAYAAINAKRASFLDVAIVAAFRAEPETAELRLKQGVPDGVRLQQADFARSARGSIVRPPTPSTIAGDRLVVDATNGIVRIENLASVTRGEITDCLSLSQPVGVGGSTLTYSLRTPDAEGDRWSPLLWFGLWNGGKATGTPLVAGNEVFMPAETFLPSLFANGFNIATMTSSGVIWSVDADSPTSGLFAATLPNRPWITQQLQLRSTGPTTVAASPYFRMPQNLGIENFDDFKERLNQTRLGSSEKVYGLGGGDGIVTAWTDKGVYGLSRGDFVVCDEGRLLKVDAAGNPVQNAFGGLFSGIGNGGSASEIRGVPRPVKAYPVGTSETLVVDAGASRIMRIDDDGTVLRSLDKIQLDPNYKPTNYRANSPLTFKDPRDATTFEGYVYKNSGDPELVTNQGATEYWIHYLVADSGNGRLVELIDRFQVDPTTGRIGAPVQIDVADPDHRDAANNPVTVRQAQVGVLVWQSPALDNTTKVGDYYNSVARIYLGGAGTGRYVYVAGVSRGRTTRTSAGLDNPGVNTPAASASSGGAVVLFDPLGGTRVFDRFRMPDLRGTRFLTDPATGTFGTNPNLVRQDGRPFSGIQAVTAAPFLNGDVISVRIMVTDADALYEFTLDAATLANANLDPTGGGTLAPDWMMNESAFTALRSSNNYGTNALRFRPAYARRLDSGDVLVVNGYRGLTRNGQETYSGEVSLFDGKAYNPTADNLGFTSNSVRLGLPPLTGIRDLVSPVFADRR